MRGLAPRPNGARREGERGGARGSRWVTGRVRVDFAGSCVWASWFSLARLWVPAVYFVALSGVSETVERWALGAPAWSSEPG